MNTLCAGLHTLAVYNYRDANLIQYFLKLVNILVQAQHVINAHPRVLDNRSDFEQIEGETLQ